MRNYDYGYNENQFKDASLRKTYEQDSLLRHKTQRFHSNFEGESINGIVGLNAFPRKEIVKGKYSDKQAYGVHSGQYFNREYKRH